MVDEADTVVFDEAQMRPHATWGDVRMTAELLTRRYGVFAEAARRSVAFYRAPDQTARQDRIDIDAQGAEAARASRVLGAIEQLELQTRRQADARVLGLGAHLAQADHLIPPPEKTDDGPVARTVRDSFWRGELIYRYITEAHLLCDAIPSGARDRADWNAMPAGARSAPARLSEATLRWKSDWSDVGERVQRPSERAVIAVIAEEIPTLPPLILDRILESLHRI